MPSSKTGCDLSHKRLTLIANEKPSDKWVPGGRRTGRRAMSGEQESDESGGQTFVAMMQATDFWDGDDSADAATLNRAGIRTILVER